jgi:hypothetical protein
MLKHEFYERHGYLQAEDMLYEYNSLVSSMEEPKQIMLLSMEEIRMFNNIFQSKFDEMKTAFNKELTQYIETKKIK